MNCFNTWVRYTIELKSFTDEYDFKQSQKQAAQYAAPLNLNQIFLIEFVEHIPEEVDYLDQDTGVTVTPVFAAIGS